MFFEFTKQMNVKATECQLEIGQKLIFQSLLGDVHWLELPPEVPPLPEEADGVLGLPAHHAPTLGAAVATPHQLAAQSEIQRQIQGDPSPRGPGLG